MATPAKQFYRRVLPEKCIAFGSERGRRLFTEALHDGYMESYFGLSAQFCTQAEPAFCGLTTLVVALNTLEVDPHRVWKGVWRWYHEDMLECCVPLERIKEKGITFDEFICLACCNTLEVKATFVDSKVTVDHFRDVIKRCSRSSKEILVATYWRPGLDQTGTGHFSPLGGYHAGEDMVLILDTARFKYPPHWVKVPLLFDAMKRLDPGTGLPRGYAVLKKIEKALHQMIMFKVSPTLCVPMKKDENRNDFLTSWTDWLTSKCSDQSNEVTWQDAIGQLLKSSRNIAEELLTTQLNLSCDSLPVSDQHSCAIQDLMQGLESTPLFQITRSFLQQHQSLPMREETTMAQPIESEHHPAKRSKISQEGEDGKSGKRTCEPCGGVFHVGAAHLNTMLLLSWPYSRCCGHISGRLAEMKAGQVENTSALFQNEVLQLNRQLASVLAHKVKCIDCKC